MYEYHDGCFVKKKKQKKTGTAYLFNLEFLVGVCVDHLCSFLICVRFLFLLCCLSVCLFVLSS